MTSSTNARRSVSGVAVPDVPAQLFVDGEWHDAADGATFDVVAPASEEHLATVAADVDAAVRAARREADGGTWSRLTGAERGRQDRGEDGDDHPVNPGLTGHVHPTRTGHVHPPPTGHGGFDG
jgi:hypothetical protein